MMISEMVPKHQLDRGGSSSSPTPATAHSQPDKLAMPEDAGLMFHLFRSDNKFQSRLYRAIGEAGEEKLSEWTIHLEPVTGDMTTNEQLVTTDAFAPGGGARGQLKVALANEMSKNTTIYLAPRAYKQGPADEAKRLKNLF